jgi:hypothetical protein
MFEQLLASRAWLASWIAGLALLNYSVSLLLLDEYSKQTFVERDAWRPPGLAGRLRSDAAQLALPTAATGLVALLALVADHWMRETLIGGVLVMQMATLASNVADLLTYRALSAPNAAEGHLRYSAEYRFRSAAARLVGMTLMTALIGVLFGSTPFLVGSVFLLATAGGWYRRARQAARGVNARVDAQ